MTALLAATDTRRAFAFERRRRFATARTQMLADRPRTTGCRISASISTAWTTSRTPCSRPRAKAYPSLDIPFHARWRHFVVDGVDRWAGIAGRVHGPIAPHARAPNSTSPSSAFCSMPARARPGATAMPSRGKAIGRSEGLALASLDDVCERRVLKRCARAAPCRCGRARGISVAALEQRLSGQRRQSAGRPRGPRRSAAPARPAGGPRNRRCSALNDTPRPGGLFDHLVGARARQRDRRAGDPVARCCVSSARSGRRG